jgi:NAD(P)-dependent dehydrogenase (short-subunit alcohol dehydrogenase family)
MTTVAIEAFVRAAAIELASGVRINAVSPTVLEDSPEYFRFFCRRYLCNHETT